MADSPTPDAIPVDAAASELDALRARLDAAEQHVNNYKLLVADFDNMRKRLTRDAEAQKKYAAESLMRDLLTALDNLDRALAAAKKAGDAGPLVVGVSATATQFLDVLRRYGVTKIDCPPGTPFDPNVHEAVTQVPTNDYEPGSVAQVVQQGYLLHDRVLRPAAVIVSAAPPAGSPD